MPRKTQRAINPLNTKKALSDGSLLTHVARYGLQVTLHLKEVYNRAKGYQAVNKTLYDLYKTSLDFQENFEPPMTGVSLPILRLKENHGYADDNAILEALKTFATRQKNLKIKAALRNDNLLIGITKNELAVTLHLAENHPNIYKSFNHALCGMYKVSAAFQSAFEQPYEGVHPPVLLLKAGHGYADENAILEALKTFAAPQKPLAVRAALRDGSLLTGVTLEGLQVTLHLAAAYHQTNHYKSVSNALYHLYQKSCAFQAVFEQPKKGLTHEPVLQLKENHRYTNGEAVLSALRSFAEGKANEPTAAEEIPDVYEQNNDTLINSTQNDLLTILDDRLSEDNQPHYPELTNFLMPWLIEETTPTLQLSGYGEVEENQIEQTVQEMLGEENDDDFDLRMRQSEQSNKRKLPAKMSSGQKNAKRLNAKKALYDGSLLTGVTLVGLKVTLHLTDEYNHARGYSSVNKTLYDIYRTSLGFQAVFEVPQTGNFLPILRLKANHEDVDDKAILAYLKFFATPEKRLKIKDALHDGSLLAGVTRERLQVTLHLQLAYNQIGIYKSVIQTLYELYQTSAAFQEKFEKPNRGGHAPVLRLKMNHGYADENAILEALKAFAAPQKHLNIKASLADGSLLAGVTLEGLQVTLHLAAAYHQTNHYKSVSNALYHLYQKSCAFQAVFERPKKGLTHEPVLQLKENHRYTNSEAVLSALRSFAEGKANEPTAAEEIPDVYEQNNDTLINSTQNDLLRILGDRLSDHNQQIYAELTNSSMSLMIEEAPPILRLSGDSEVEANKVAQTIREILGEDNGVESLYSVNTP